MDIQYFYQIVRDERDAIFAAIQKQPGQPKGAVLDQMECRRKGFTTGYYRGWCYVTSIKNREKGTTDGCVSEIDINLAGLRVAEMTHRLATDEEIRGFKKAGLDRADEIKRMEVARLATKNGQVFLNAK